MPPPDNPLAREQGRSASRLAGEETLELLAIGDGRRVAVTAAAMAAPKARTAGAKKSTAARMAALRLKALEAAGRHQPVKRATRRLAAVAAAPPVAPVPGASNWTQLGPTAIPKGQTYGGGRVLVTGRVTAIAIDPTNRDRVYLGTAQGGVWRSTDRGGQWLAVTDNAASLAIGALAIDPNDHLTIYAGTGEANFSQDSYYGAGVLKSTDGGTTWTQLGASSFVGLRIARIAVTPGTGNRVFAATGGGLYRSADGGTSWARMTGTPLAAATDVTIDPTTPATVVASFWGGAIYRSTNAGAATPTWTQLGGGLPTANVTRVALGRAPSNPLALFALTVGPWNADPSLAYLVNGLYRSTDGGTSWSSIALPGGDIGGQGFYNLNVAVDPTTPDVVYLSGVSLWKGVRNTATGAWSFTDVGGGYHPDNHALAFDPTDHLTLYAGSDGGIYRSTNGGTSWDDSINCDLCLTQFEYISAAPRLGRGRARRDAGQRHGAVPEQPGLLPLRRRRRRLLPDRPEPAAELPQHLLQQLAEALDAGGAVRHVDGRVGRDRRGRALLPAARRRPDEPEQRRVRDGPDQPRHRAGHGRLADEGRAAGPRRRRVRVGDLLPELDPDLRRHHDRQGVPARPDRRDLGGHRHRPRAAAVAVHLGHRRASGRPGDDLPRHVGVRLRARLARRDRRGRDGDLDGRLGRRRRPAARHPGQRPRDRPGGGGHDVRRHRRRRLPHDERRRRVVAVQRGAAELRGVRHAAAPADAAAARRHARARPVGAEAGHGDRRRTSGCSSATT